VTRLPRRAIALACVVAAAGMPALAHDAHRHATSAPGSAKVVLGDASLVDQGGKRVQLAKDVIGERIAIVNFVYTTCTTICPVSSAVFAQLQERLGSALGREVVLVSITVDPVRDTPERLRESAARYGARAGWIWLTGAKREVDGVLKGFGAYAPNYDDHPPMMLVGDATRGIWFRFFGFPSVEQLLARVEAIAEARQHAKE
jgi:protein SCO1/2